MQQDRQIFFTTEQLTASAFVDTDLVIFTAYRQQPCVAQYQSWDTDYSLDDAKAMFANMNYQQFGQVDKWFQIALTLNSCGTLIGDLALHFVDEQQLELGITLAPEYQQQGFGLEAVTGVVNYVFQQLGKHRITAITDSQNSACAALLTKAGFRKEAHFVQNIFFKGAWGDEFQFALLASEINLDNG
ncbi:GNAT family N-acetyltransferase [Shewanella intestini]|uniref:GNAT family N-acetyltransferase n=1 Tax=Shewanella intestini TaxID=2017544 RepID=A0ABS5I012_9GAMM|nr:MULTISPECIES: GNAT family protein [Shewanella]MBR9727019.1 GNAT family N-acetyltransferase [Shewanella intestini]MRG35820.1 GNAT family N-acetyltransferase [Shewanella sp. XMDDZSB0408]